MKALVKRERAEGLWLEDHPVPEIGTNDLLIRVDRTGTHWKKYRTNFGVVAETIQGHLVGDCPVYLAVDFKLPKMSSSKLAGTFSTVTFSTVTRVPLELGKGRSSSPTHLSTRPLRSRTTRSRTRCAARPQPRRPRGG